MRSEMMKIQTQWDSRVTNYPLAFLNNEFIPNGRMVYLNGDVVKVVNRITLEVAYTPIDDVLIIKVFHKDKDKAYKEGLDFLEGDFNMSKLCDLLGSYNSKNFKDNHRELFKNWETSIKKYVFVYKVSRL